MCSFVSYSGKVRVDPDKWLYDDDKSLYKQSKHNCDSWGVWTSETDLCQKGIGRLPSTISKSPTYAFMAHVRRATKGRIDIGNTQPFHHDNLKFMHNGTVLGYERYGCSDSYVIFENLVELTNKSSCIYKVHWYLQRHIIEEMVEGTLNFVLQGDSYTMFGRVAKNKIPIPLYYKLDLRGLLVSSKNMEGGTMTLLPKNTIGIYSKNTHKLSILSVG
jgi:hypothetical protein